MSEIDQLISLVSNILQPNDKILRENSEKTLVGLRSSNPNELMMTFLAILNGNIYSYP